VHTAVYSTPSIKIFHVKLPSLANWKNYRVLTAAGDIVWQSDVVLAEIDLMDWTNSEEYIYFSYFAKVLVSKRAISNDRPNL